MADGRHLEVDISRYLSEKSDDFLKILYAAADFEKKLHWTDSEFDRT